MLSQGYVTKEFFDNKYFLFLSNLNSSVKRPYYFGTADTPFNSISNHAQQRLAQRNISMRDIEFALKYGKKLYRSGVFFVFLGRHDIPFECQNDDRFSKLEGITLLISKDSGCLITAYKNKHALKQIKRKQKYKQKGRNLFKSNTRG